MATIDEVARRAGVGVGTVSRVLNGRPRVAPATRERVLSIIAELDYHPSAAARGLSLGRTSSVGVIVPFVTQLSVVERVRGIVQALGGSGYDMVLFAVETPSQRDDVFRRVAIGGPVDGVLVVSLPPRDDELDRLGAAGRPAVLVDAAHPRLPSVVTDDVEGGCLATDHLLALGHRRIAFVGDAPDPAFGFSACRMREQGYRTSMAAAGVAVDEALVRRGPHGREVAHALTRALLELREPPTAVFASSDTQALGVLEAAGFAGYRVPEDLSVVGYDDIEVAPYAGLSTVSQPLLESGTRGARLLLEALDGHQGPPAREQLPLTLVPRRTTGPVGGRAPGRPTQDGRPRPERVRPMPDPVQRAGTTS